MKKPLGSRMLSIGIWRIMVPVALVFMCSCATEKPYTLNYRNYPTGISADEGVVILLNTFHSNDKFVESEGEEKSLANCVSDGMMKVDPKLRSVSAKDFRRTVFPGKGFLDSPRSPEDLLSFLSDPSAQSRVMGLGVRYVIVLTATTSESKENRKFGGQNVFSVSREWSESAGGDADVLDVQYRRESGKVHAGCSGKGEWAAGCFGCATLYLPCVIPFGFYHSPSCETKACSALGEDVMKFLMDSHDVVPTTESGEDLLRRTQEPERYDKGSQN